MGKYFGAFKMMRPFFWSLENIAKSSEFKKRFVTERPTNKCAFSDCPERARSMHGSPHRSPGHSISAIVRRLITVRLIRRKILGVILRSSIISNQRPNLRPLSGV